MTEAYFRRFIIVPFNVEIPKAERDPELAKKIIANELSGVFNWVLDGLHRLLKQKAFTTSSVIQEQQDTFKRESDSVAMFIYDEGYAPSIDGYTPLKELYESYVSYCYDNGYHRATNKTVSGRLKNLGFGMERKGAGMFVHIKK